MAEFKAAAVIKGKEMELERLRVEIEHRKAETERLRESKEASEAETRASEAETTRLKQETKLAALRVQQLQLERDAALAQMMDCES